MVYSINTNGEDIMREQITPTDGMPCTMGIGSDRYAMYVAKVLSPKRIIVLHEKAPYAPDADYSKSVWSLRKDGNWRPAGTGANGGYYLILGRAESYRDPSF